MEFNLNEGILGEKEIMVELEHTASRFGSGLMDVFSTPALVALMETTAQMSVQKFLPQPFITLGIEINVKHKKATPVGQRVFCASKLIGIEGKKLLFEIIAKDSQGIVGEATHKRYIVNGDEFIEGLNKSFSNHG